ncbi:heterokaryon incompatibility protein-domain-containing protein [Hyaloscypha sp. PMI_1271]|nr:heterokaryon incompatibility protein-domain-containing protein [Hyaloscypha sp. PMI_1271]
MSSCTMCKYLNYGEQDVSGKALLQSATTGCLVCALFCDALKLINDGAVSRCNTARNKHSLQITVGFRTIIMQGREDVSNPWNFPAMSRLNTNWTGSPDSIQRAAQWLQACITRHRRCGQSLEPLLPDRILDIGLSLSSNIIVLQETIDQRDRYICLSYCWGLSEFISTTRDNISSHKEGIQLQSLPQTFRDAIFVSRALNIRYIWIDSLCIIQNDDRDWSTQAQKMAAIYSNSYLTISAASGRCADSGLFSEPLPVNIGTLYARVFTHLPGPSTKNSISTWPLISRGWAFQERLLAPRVLHFGRDELIWDCNETRECQCGTIFTFNNDIRKSDFHDALHNGTITSQTKLGTLWRRIVVQYCSLALTKPSDKFPAIAGIAEVVQLSRNSAYLGGLWSDTLVLDLLWRAREPREDSQEILGRAPSWSWASVGGPIEYSQELYLDNRRDPIIHCEFLHGEIISTNKTKAGFVQLKCSKIKVECIGRNLENQLLDMYVRFYPDRTQILDGDYYIIRMAQVWNDELLVLRILDAGKQTYQRVGLGEHRGGKAAALLARCGYSYYYIATCRRVYVN